MAKKLIHAIFGTGGFAREIMDIVSVGAGGDENVLFFEDVPRADLVNNIRVLATDEMFMRAKNEQILFTVALGNSHHRRRIAEKCIEAGMIPFSASAATLHRYSEIGEGAVLCGYTIVQANARIGKFFQLNMHSYVAHDCVIGDFVTFAPHVCCNGNVHIGDDSYIGTGATLINGKDDKPLVIGRGVTIGMGAVVLRDVPDGEIVIGNPGRLMRKPGVAAI